jgi:hypothetical protein
VPALSPHACGPPGRRWPQSEVPALRGCIRPSEAVATTTCSACHGGSGFGLDRGRGLPSLPAAARGFSRHVGTRAGTLPTLFTIFHAAKARSVTRWPPFSSATALSSDWSTAKPSPRLLLVPPPLSMHLSPPNRKRTRRWGRGQPGVSGRIVSLGKGPTGRIVGEGANRPTGRTGRIGRDGGQRRRSWAILVREANR